MYVFIYLALDILSRAHELLSAKLLIFHNHFCSLVH